MHPDLVEYCRQRTEAAYRMHKWFQESMDMARLMYPLPEANNGSEHVCDVPNDRLGIDSGKDSGE
jgi:hypothetical protein